MPVGDLINFIKERLVEGFSKEEIKKTLLDTGYTLQEVEEAFQAISEKEKPPGPEIPREEVLPYKLGEEEVPYFQPKTSLKKFPLPLMILVALILVGGASAFIYSKIVKPDPISLLPQETAFYLRVKINPEDKQVKNLKENLNKFPYYEKFAQKISDWFEKQKEENPPLKNLDFTISNEIILAWISPFEPGKEIEEIPLVLILPDPDLKKLEKLAKDVQDEIKKSKDWKLETEDYKGRKIYKAIPTKESTYWPSPGEPKLEPSSAYTNGHFVLTTKSEDITKIIDVAEDQGITKIFKKGKIKNINSGIAYRKIKKYLPKDYLALFYGELDWSKILKTAETIETVKTTEELFAPFTASLKAAIDLPFFKSKEIGEIKKVAFAGTIIAEKDELKMESYSLDLRTEAFEPSQFSLNESLANFLPEKIGNKEIIYYGEGRNLKSSFEEMEKILTKEMTGEEKENYEKLQKELKENIGIDLKEDILALFEKNYAFFLASEPTEKEKPVVAFFTEVDDEQKVKENLFKISVPKIPSIFEASSEAAQSRARDARRKADLAMLRTGLELYFDDFKRYPTSLEKLYPKYITPVPKDPLTEKSYSYQLKEVGKSYTLSATLETGAKIIYTPLGKEEIPGNILPLSPEEKVSFSKEVVNGFEIYTLPISEEFGLNFSIKDKKLILTLTKEGLVNFLKSVGDPSQKKLKDSELFAEHFKKVPKDITGISYSYPYGFLGATKWLANFIIGLYQQGFESALGGGILAFEAEKLQAPIFEFLDKGIAPYLKVLKSSGSYSYSPEKGLLVRKGRLIIGELPAEEKKATEEFWANIKGWFEEKFGPPTFPLSKPRPSSYLLT